MYKFFTVRPSNLLGHSANAVRQLFMAHTDLADNEDQRLGKSAGDFKHEGRTLAEVSSFHYTLQTITHFTITVGENQRAMRLVFRAVEVKR